MLRPEFPWLEGTDRMRSVVAPLALLVVLMSMASGCARTVYTHPDYTPQKWVTDSYECERDMRQSGSFGTGILDRPTFYDRCLSVRGWTKTRE